ncbi:MAG: PAS domain-containing protein [Anaerolineae bacterium]|nr:PAS domain-containing protein [Anaerolineae bacterium]
MGVISTGWQNVRIRFSDDTSGIITTWTGWNTWWFCAFVAGLSLGIFWLLYRAKANKLKTEQAMTAKLRESEERFSKAFRSSPAALNIVDFQSGKMREVNQAWSRMTGFSREEAVGRTTVELGLLTEEMRQGLIDEIVAKGRIHNVEFTFKNRFQQSCTVLGSMELFDVDGEPTELVTMIDITERKRIEEALRESERQLATLISNLPGMAYRCRNDRNWTMVFVSGGCFHLTGYQATDLLYNHTIPYAQLIHPDDREYVWQTVQTAIDKREPFEAVYRLTTVDGQEKWVWERGQAIFIEEQNTGVLEGFVNDITERKHAEEALREKEAHLEEAQALAKLGSWILYPEIQNGVWSKQMFALFGLDPAGGTPEFTQFLDRVHPDDRSNVVAANEKAIQTGVTSEVEYKTNPAYGPVRHLIAEGHAVHNEQGHLLYIAGTVQDITERKQNEEQLREHEHFISAIVNTTPAIVYVYDMETQSNVYINTGVERLLGYTPEEIQSRGSDLFADLIHLDDMATVLAFQEQVAAADNQDVLEIVYRLRHADGNWRTLHSFERPFLRNSGGALKQKIGVAIDITNEIKLEEQFRQAQKLESIGRLAGGIAHDFNNLLVPILGYAELGMTELAPSNALYSNLTHIKKAAERAADLTQQILAFSRRQLLELRTLDLNEVITDFRKMAQRLIREDIEVNVHLEPSLGYIRADKAQMDQILMNLMINAGDAMPTGGKLTIETANMFLDEAYLARYAVEQKPGPFVMLAISDTGQGMDAETREHIFEPFFTTKDRGQGTGLGLATIFGIVKQHQGHIWVYSEPGQGTTFKIYLPQTKEVNQPVKAHQHESAPVYGTETVLVVEDEKMVRELVCETLTAHGYQVIEASNPDHALQLAAGHKETLHLLLTDVIMPKMNGRELHQQLIAIKPNIKTLYMSGYTDNVIVHHGILDDDIEFLQKPFTITQLTQKVRTVLTP